MQNFMKNSMVHLDKFFLLVKRCYEKKRKCRFFVQNQFFTDSILSVVVLKLTITTINWVACLQEAGRKTYIFSG